MRALKVLDAAQFDLAHAARLARRATHTGYYAFYSSIADAITTEPHAMRLPIDDHALVRGHAVFDTCSLVERRIYRLKPHLDRLCDSADAARIALPFADGSRTSNIAAFTDIIHQTCVASNQPTADVRYWLTAGTGNLGVTPEGCEPAFYVLVFGGLPSDPAWQTDGVREATVPVDLVPHKPRMLAELKSNNYMLNALTAMAARDRGGTFGIGVDADANISESCVLNVVALGKDGILRTPPFEGILKGTTVRRVFELVESLRSSGAIQVESVSQEKLPISAARDARELFLCAGDTHLYPVVELDGSPIADGRVGPVASTLLSALQHDAKLGQGGNHEHLQV